MAAQARSGMQRLDFSFAFGDERFSDCVLRIRPAADGPSAKRHCASGASASEEASPSMREVKVSSLVLSANSPYFKSMFTGTFREGFDKRTVDIHLDAEYETQFSDLVHFMYMGVLPEGVGCSLPSLLNLMVLADQFQCEHCFSACTEALTTFLPELKWPNALCLLSLPETLQRHAQLVAALDEARRCVVKAFTSHLSEPSSHALQRLPEVALVTLLEADDLNADMEDTVARAGWAWAKANYPAGKDCPEAFFRLVLPNVRMQSLSPKMVKWVCERVSKQVLPGHPGLASDPSPGLQLRESRKRALSEEGGAAGRRQEAGASSTLKQVKSEGVAEETPSEPKSSSSVGADTSPRAAGEAGQGQGEATKGGGEKDEEANGEGEQGEEKTKSAEEEGEGEGEHDGDSLETSSRSSHLEARVTIEAREAALRAVTAGLLAMSDQLFVEYGVVGPGEQLRNNLTGWHYKAARASCKLPHHRMFLQIPLRRCLYREPSEYLAVSSPSLVSGRWFTLNAQVAKDSLGFYIVCDKKSNTVADSTKEVTLSFRFAIQTQNSRPAYQGLRSRTKGTFDQKQVREGSGWGLPDCLEKKWSKVVEERETYFPDGAMRVRADLWVVEPSEDGC